MSSVKLLFEKLKSLDERLHSLFIISLIALIFLYPMFLGKVDTPVDIRNVQMYPWRYYAVDAKVRKITLWEYISKSSPVFELKIPPSDKNEYLFRLNLDKPLVDKLSKKSDTNYYLRFDFHPSYDETIKFNSINFGVLFVSDIVHDYFAPPIQVSKISDSSQGTWYQAHLPLNKELKKIGSVEDLKFYNLLIKAFNNSGKRPSTLYIKNLKLICEDASSTPKIHNPYNNDLIQGFTPNREFFSNSIKKWHIPFWYHYLLTGIENVDDPQVGYFHPFYFLTYLIFDHFTAHQIITFICFVLSGFGAFLLTRYWGLNFWASLFTGIVYIFHPFNVVWFSFEHALMNSAILPFLLLAYEKNLHHYKLINKNLLTCALLQGLIFLSGHLQVSYYTAIFFLLFAAFKFIQNISAGKREFIKHIFSVCFIFAIGLMMASVVLIPVIPFIQNSYRVPWSKEIIMQSSIPLKAFLGLFYPYYMGTDASQYGEPPYGWGFARNYMYFGLLPFIFSLFTFKVISKNKHVAFFYFAIIFSVLIFTGSPIFFLIRDFIPGFKQLQHNRFVEGYSYSVPFLAGIGFQVFYDFIAKHKLNLVKIISAVIILISILDLFYYSSYSVTWSNRNEYKPLPKNGSLEFIINQQKKSKEPFRILPFTNYRVGENKFDVALPNTLLPYLIEDVSGYSSFVSRDLYSIFVYIQTKNPNDLYTKEIVSLFSNTNIPYPIYNFQSKFLDLFNVRYFLVPNFLKLYSNDIKKVFDGDCAIYENINVLPRAFLVPSYKIIKSAKKTILEIDKEEFNPLKKVILMSLPVKYHNEIIQINKGQSELKYSLDFLKYEQEKIILKVNVNRSGILLYGGNLNWNWRVKVNGKQDELFQANLVQKGVFLPRSGEYIVEFYYYPKLFLIGLLISAAALLILLALTVWLIRKEKSERSLLY